MRKVPREIDALIWEVAESNDPKMIDSFGERYPEYRSELLLRIRMVHGLRGGKPVPRPVRFEPTPVAPAIVTRRYRLAWAGVGLAIVIGVSFAGYALVSYISGRHQQEATVTDTQPLPKAPKVERFVRAKPVPQAPQQQQEPAPQPQHEVTCFEKPVSLVSDKISLHQALQTVGRQAGFEVVIAPNTPNPLVVLHYEGMAAMDVLKDMGKNFGFTPMIQDERSLLVIPAVEKPAKPSQLPGTGDMRLGDGVKP